MPFGIVFSSALLLSFIVIGQIPRNDNKEDAAGKRQGTWTILLDAELQSVQDPSLAEYYRIITYDNDKPVGTVKNYHKNGNLQFSGALLADRPKDIFDGFVTVFRIDGTKETEASIKKESLRET